MYTAGNVTLMVSDLGRSVQFYTESLGFELKNRWGDHFAEVQGPSLTIGLHPGRDATASPVAGSASIGLAVDDIVQAVALLRERGVNIADIQEGKMQRIAHFADPDQTPMYLFQMR